MNSNQILQKMLLRHRVLKPLEGSIVKAADAIINAFKNGGKVLVCGNGGSSADAEHIVSELMKSFEDHRPLNDILQKKLKELSPERGNMLARKLQQGLPAISLSAHNALITAITNDINGDVIFAQQVTGLGNKGDVLMGLSTSGSSQNIVDAFIVAKAKGLTTIGITGETGGTMKKWSDILINVPEKRTAFVQELHMPVYHAICMMIEDSMFG